MSQLATVNGVENLILQRLVEFFPAGANHLSEPPLAVPLPNGDNGAAAEQRQPPPLPNGDNGGAADQLSRHRYQTVITVAQPTSVSRHRYQTVVTVASVAGGLPRVIRAGPATRMRGESRPSGAPSTKW